MLNKRKLLFIILMCVSNVVHATLPLCISLGSACASALTLRHLHLRAEAYPFDWILSPFEAIYKAIGDDFKYFLTDIRLRDGGQGIIDYYGFHFTHDLPTVSNPNIDVLVNDFVLNDTLSNLWEKALPMVKEKYNRRIQRFRKACLGQEKVFFLRSQDVKENVIMLKDLIKDRYPKLDFLIIAIAGLENYTSAWNVDHIKNFYNPTWNDHTGWGYLIKQSDSAFNSLVVRDRCEFADELNDHLMHCGCYS